MKLKNLKSGVGNKILTVGPPSERTKNNNYEEMDEFCLTCRQCSSKFVIGTSEGWLPCENCINWYCSLCVGVLQDEKCNSVNTIKHFCIFCFNPLITLFYN